MNYHHLYYFFKIAKEGSITKACESLHLSQPALSAQLKQFEHALKRPLFERHKKRLKLTEDGRMVLDYAERIFDLGQQLEDTLRDRSPSGRHGIQIGVMNGTPRAFTDAMVAHLLNKAPGAHISIEERSLNTLIHKLTDLSLDIILTDTPVADPKGIDCSNLFIGRVPVVFAATPQLVKKYKGALEQKDEIPFILPSAPSLVFEQVKDFLTHGKINARIVSEVQDMEVAGRLAVQGFGVVPLSLYLLDKPPYSKVLKDLKWKSPEEIHENLYLVTRNRQWPNPLALQLLKSFRV